MKIKRIISLILAALMTASLCAFVMGCASSEEEKPKSELEIAREKAIHIYKNYDSEYTNIFKKYKEDGEKQYVEDNFYLLLNEISYNMLCDYFQELKTPFKEAIENAETIEQLEKAEDDFLKSVRYAYPVRYINNPLSFFAMAQKFYKQVVFNVDGDTLSVTDYLPKYSSSLGGSFYFTTAAEGFLVECLSERGLWVIEEEDKSRVITSQGSLEYRTPIDGECGYFDFILYKNDEIVGYVIYDYSKIVFSAKKIVKAVTFEKEDRKKLTREKVLSYINSAKQGKDEEFVDGIVPIKSYENDIYNSLNAVLYSWHDDTEEQFNEFKFLWDPINDSDACIYEIVSRDGTFLYNGANVNKASVKSGESIFWNKDTIAEGYIEIYRKCSYKKSIYDEKQYYVDGFILIRIDKIDEMKKVKVMPVLLTGAEQFDGHYFNMKMTESYVKTVKRMIRDGSVKI